MNVQIEIPRIVSRQRHRPNIQADNPEQYYRRTVAIPLLDTINYELDTRFNELSTTASRLLCLIPSILCSDIDYSDDLEKCLDLYKKDLVDCDLVTMEISLWKRKWLNVNPELRPNCLSTSIAACDELRYPNLFTLLKIGCTLPITTSTCERSFSALRRLRTWLRQSINNNRLTSLALMHINYGHQIDYDKAVDLFCQLHPRKFDSSNLVYKK